MYFKIRYFIKVKSLSRKSFAITYLATYREDLLVQEMYCNNKLGNL